MKGAHCQNCGKFIPPEETAYEIRIDIYAKGGPVKIKEEDLHKDHISEMEKLIREMEKMDAEELTDQVWESYRFDLCRECRKEFHTRLKMKVTGQPPDSETHRRRYPNDDLSGGGEC